MGPQADLRDAARQHDRGDLRTGRRHSRPQHGGHPRGAGRPDAAYRLLLETGRRSRSVRLCGYGRRPVRQADLPSSARLRRHPRRHARRRETQLGGAQTAQEKPSQRYAGRSSRQSAGDGQGAAHRRKGRRRRIRLGATRRCLGESPRRDGGSRDRNAPRRSRSDGRGVRRPLLRAGQRLPALRSRSRSRTRTHQPQVHPPLHSDGGNRCRTGAYALRSDARRAGSALAERHAGGAEHATNFRSPDRMLLYQKSVR